MSTEENRLCEQIYNTYWAKLRNLAILMHVPDTDLDDVIQETFIAYFKNYSLTWTPTHMKAMLVKILKRKAIDCLRKKNRHEKVSLDETSLKDVERLTKSVVPNPLDIIVGNEDMTQIANQISEMRPEWKVIVVLYFIEQKTVSEMCEILNITRTACCSRIYRTRIGLKKILGPKYREKMCPGARAGNHVY